MIPASHVKKSIDFNVRFRSLLEVLKLVAVSQYYMLERKLKTFEKLPEMLSQFFNAIDIGGLHHPFLEPGDRPLAVVAVTSDAGLTGGMNMQVMNAAVELVRENTGRLIVVGEKGQIYAQDAGIAFTAFPGILDTERHQQASELRDYLVQQAVSGKLGSVKVVYLRAVTFVIHRVEVANILPFAPAALQPNSPSVVPASALAPDDSLSTPGVEVPPPGLRKEGALLKDVIFESTLDDILEYLVYFSMGEQLYEIFGMSRLAEQAARFTHLEESCQKILEMNKKLWLQYFRRRHEMIDQNMRELFASRSIYAK